VEAVAVRSASRTAYTRNAVIIISICDSRPQSMTIQEVAQMVAASIAARALSHRRPRM